MIKGTAIKASFQARENEHIDRGNRPTAFRPKRNAGSLTFYYSLF